MISSNLIICQPFDIIKETKVNTYDVTGEMHKNKKNRIFKKIPQWETCELSEEVHESIFLNQNFQWLMNRYTRSEGRARS